MGQQASLNEERQLRIDVNSKAALFEMYRLPSLRLFH